MCHCRAIRRIGRRDLEVVHRVRLGVLHLRTRRERGGQGRHVGIERHVDVREVGVGVTGAQARRPSRQRQRHGRRLRLGGQPGPELHEHAAGHVVGAEARRGPQPQCEVGARAAREGGFLGREHEAQGGHQHQPHEGHRSTHGESLSCAARLTAIRACVCPTAALSVPPRDTVKASVVAWRPPASAAARRRPANAGGTDEGIDPSGRRPRPADHPEQPTERGRDVGRAGGGGVPAAPELRPGEHQRHVLVVAGTACRASRRSGKETNTDR